MSPNTLPPSRLLNDLPAIYQSDPDMGQFLLAFEQLLLRNTLADFSETGDSASEAVDSVETITALESKIDRIATLLDPQSTPEEFLPWLAQWVALSLRSDLPTQKQREFIASAIQRYRYRGTRQNLQELLALFIRATADQTPDITITEAASTEFQIGVHATIGEDTYLSGAPPFFFKVALTLPRAEPKVQQRQEDITRSIIDLEKPAHTDYELDIFLPGMQIGVFSTIGVDTLLGKLSNQKITS